MFVKFGPDDLECYSSAAEQPVSRSFQAGGGKESRPPLKPQLEALFRRSVESDALIEFVGICSFHAA